MKKAAKDYVIYVEFERAPTDVAQFIRIVHVTATDEYDALAQLATALKKDGIKRQIIKILF